MEGDENDPTEIVVENIITRDDASENNPGIDAKHIDYDIHTNCRIFCSDYGEEKAFETHNLTNKSLGDFLHKKRPEGGKVRWINVDGISWDVIKELALRYDLHPLCVEDIIQCSQRKK
ncbi:6813_t:CDS:2 [Diversispora eburnea]|uniref:6813_t:CDS:1 n=1 Tax=Diversispora eburnea TaxID=1213867 RepID=A0A9N8YV78_9GLOM|nr:6813_t:CDS:2 [Diversispora eburnea]